MTFIEDAERQEAQQERIDLIALNTKLDEARDRNFELEEQLEEARNLAIYWEQAYNQLSTAHAQVRATLRAAIDAVREDNA